MRFACLSLLAVLLPTANLRADDAAEARAIVARAAKAAGIPTDGTPIATTCKVEGKSIDNGVETAFTGEMAFQTPDKYRITLKSEIGGMKVQVARQGLFRRRPVATAEIPRIAIDVLIVANGKKAWMSVMGTSQDLTGQQLEKFLEQRYQYYVIALAPLLTDREFTLSPAGEKEVNGKAAAAVKVERSQNQAMTLFFDKETGLLAKVELKTKAEVQGGKEVFNEVYFEDYKDVGGRKYYTKMRLIQDGKQTLVDTMSGQKAHEKLDPKLFEPLK